MLAAGFSPSAFHFWFYIDVSLAFGIVMSSLVEMSALTLRERQFPASSKRSAMIQVELDPFVIV